MLAFLSDRTGWLYLGIYIINFIFFIYLAFSHFGKIKLGDAKDKPAFSNFQWGSMVFATAIDASILMLSMTDPLRFLMHPAFNMKPFSAQAYATASVFGQFDWGPMAWLMFASATIAIAYAMYVKKRPIQRLSSAITVLDGKHWWQRGFRSIVDLLVVIGIMGGIGSSVGMEIPVLAKVISATTGIPDNFWLTLGLFAILFVLFALTVFAGLKGGIDKLSSAHIWTALGFLAFVLLVGPTLHLVSGEVHNLVSLGQHFTALSTNILGHHAAFPRSETIFYWGWWLSYMPFTGLFIARISKGRTVRQVVLGMIGFGALGCMSFYAILGGYTLYLQHAGIVNVAAILQSQGQAAAIARIIQTLPFKALVLVFYSVSCFIFLATTISSSAFIVSSFTSKKLVDGQEPSHTNRMFWVCVFMLFSFGIVMVGGFKTVQTICALAGFPLIFVCALLLLSIVQMVVTDKRMAEARKHSWHYEVERQAERSFDSVRLAPRRKTLKPGPMTKGI